MTPAQLTRLLTQLGLTQTEAAKQLKIADRTVRRWVAGDTAIPESVAMLLAVWLRERRTEKSTTSFHAAKGRQTEPRSEARARKIRGNGRRG